MCLGRIASCWNCESTLPTGCSYLTTRVFGSGAEALLMWAISPAVLPPPVPWYLTSVLIVQAASSAVSGLPSDHFEPETVWNVHVRPSFEVSHFVAKSGANCRSLSYWTRNG